MTSVLIALGVAVLLVGGGVVVFARSGWNVLGTRFEDQISLSTAIAEIEVRGGSGSVEVTATPGSQIEVRRGVRYLKPLRGRPAAMAGPDGAVMRLDTSCGWFCVIDYRVRVPEGVRVRGELNSGSIDLTGVSNVDVKTTSGTIALTRVSGDVKARSSSGSINGRDLRPTVVDAAASSGDISLSLASRCDVRARAKSGNLDLAVPDGGYRIDTTTNSGSKRIRVPDDPSSQHHLDLGTSSGAITVTRSTRNSVR